MELGLSKYTFEITTPALVLQRTFEALTLSQAVEQCRKAYPKSSVLGVKLLAAFNSYGKPIYTIDNKPNLPKNLSFNEIETKTTLDMYESNSFKLAFLIIVVGAFALGFTIGLLNRLPN